MDAPDLETEPRVPAREFANVLDELLEYPRDDYPVEALDLAATDAPNEVTVSDQLELAWLESAHARAGVNCSACHQPRDAEGQRQPWKDRPGMAGCQACHAVEIDRFGRGKHGMRVAASLSPMTPSQARLPMAEDAAHSELTCNSCHPAHRYDTRHAAVDACLACHADGHSLAYEGSPHQRLWQAEQRADSPEGSGVSCATCHMPRIDYDVSDWVSRKIVEHNQSATLAPNSKMIRPACLHCHGLGFAIDALADRALIDNNFRGRPGVRVESIPLARADHERYLRERAEAVR